MYRVYICILNINLFPISRLFQSFVFGLFLISRGSHGHTPKFEFNFIFNNISVLSCNRVILNINTGAKLTSVLFIHGPNKDFLEPDS